MKSKGLFGGVFDLMDHTDEMSTKENKSGGFFAKLLSYGSNERTELNLESIGFRPSEFNPSIPENVLVITSGAEYIEETASPNEDIKRLATTFVEQLEKSPLTFKMFADTDGDKRESSFTKLALATCQYALIPITPDEADFERVHNVAHNLNELRQEGLIDVQVQKFIWNNLAVNKNEPSEYGNFTTTKATGQVIAMLNRHIHHIGRKHPDLFSHTAPAETEGPGYEEFIRAITLHCRQIPPNILTTCNGKGTPVCKMTGGKYLLETPYGDVLEYSLGESVIREIQKNYESIVPLL
jgi:hypothetical protein